MKGFTREEALKDREKDLNQVMEGFALSLNFKFKCLENAFERTQSRGLVPFIVRDQPLLDLLMGELGPGCIVQLSDVVDDILNTAHDDLAASVCHVYNVVKCGKNVLFEHLAVSFTD